MPTTEELLEDLKGLANLLLNESKSTSRNVDILQKMFYGTLESALKPATAQPYLADVKLLLDKIYKSLPNIGTEAYRNPRGFDNVCRSIKENTKCDLVYLNIINDGDQDVYIKLYDFQYAADYNPYFAPIYTILVRANSNERLTNVLPFSRGISVRCVTSVENDSNEPAIKKPIFESVYKIY